MPEYTVPGVYIDEATRPAPIVAVASAAAGFVGVAEALPDVAPPASAITAAFAFGWYWSTAPTIGGVPNLLWPAVQGYFANGGQLLHIVAVTPAEAAAGGHATAVARLADIAANIIAAPDVQALAPTAADATMQALAALAGELAANRFALLDASSGLSVAAISGWRASLDAPGAALYWPWLQLADGTLLPPSAFVAGVIARSDRDRGIWKAPANLPLTGVSAAAPITNADQQLLNPEGINAIRDFPGKGLLVWGARTLSRDPLWQYVSVRRLASMIEASITAGLRWTVFIPNAPALWIRVRELVLNFMMALWQQGALLGDKPGSAFFVHCDTSTMTADDVAEGRLIIQIGFAAVRPMEFINLRMILMTAP